MVTGLDGRISRQTGAVAAAVVAADVQASVEISTR